MKTIVLSFLASLLVGLSASGQTPQQWRDSLSVINGLIATSPYSTDLHLRKAAINIELQQWEYAIEEYGTVLAKEPKNPAALFYRAYANTHLRRYDLARNDYETLLMLAPRNMEARLGLAHTLTLMGRTTDAMDQMNTLVEQHPDSAVAYVARAGLETELQAYDAALYDWDEALRLAPHNVDYLISKADLLITMGRKEDAREVLDAAVRRGVNRGALREWYDRCR